MDQWKQTFLDRLHDAQVRCGKRFEDALRSAVVPAFDELSQFLRDNGFRTSMPLNEPGRRSFKFELAENAYLLMIFRFSGVGEFELRTETFVPGAEPVLHKAVGRLTDLNEEWSGKQFQTGLDAFVKLLGGAPGEAPASGNADSELEEAELAASA